MANPRSRLGRLLHCAEILYRRGCARTARARQSGRPEPDCCGASANSARDRRAPANFPNAPSSTASWTWSRPKRSPISSPPGSEAAARAALRSLEGDFSQIRARAVRGAGEPARLARGGARLPRGGNRLPERPATGRWLATAGCATRQSARRHAPRRGVARRLARGHRRPAERGQVQPAQCAGAKRTRHRHRHRRHHARRVARKRRTSTASC